MQIGIPVVSPSMNRPEQVTTAFERLRANAREAERLESAAYCHYDSGNGEWRVSSNYEDGTGTYVYRDATWYYRDPWTGEDREVPFEEVLSDCSIWFTG